MILDFYRRFLFWMMVHIHCITWVFRWTKKTIVQFQIFLSKGITLQKLHYFLTLDNWRNAIVTTSYFFHLKATHGSHRRKPAVFMNWKMFLWELRVMFLCRQPSILSVLIRLINSKQVAGEDLGDAPNLTQQVDELASSNYKLLECLAAFIERPICFFVWDSLALGERVKRCILFSDRKNDQEKWGKRKFFMLYKYLLSLI